jgi:hypothetical protein
MQNRSLPSDVHGELRSALPMTAERRRGVLVVLALSLAAAAAYSSACSDVFVGYNALRSIRDNEDIRSLSPLSRAMSLHLTGEQALADGGTFVRRPVLSLSFALNQAILGNRAGSYVLVNILIHFAAALLLFALTRRTLRAAGWREGDGLGAGNVAFAVALLWLVHPLQTQSVTYFVQRAESLMGLFFLLALYAGARAFATDGSLWKTIAVAACALGVATKEVMATAPLVLYLYDATFVSESFSAPLRRRPVFYALLAATWLIPATLVAATMDDVRIDFRPGRTLPYLLAQPGVILHYLKLSFWPDALFLYVNTQLFSIDPGTTSAVRILAPFAAIAGLLGASLWGIRKKRWYGFVGGTFFLILAPTSTIVATNDTIQEHRMYLPLAAVISLTVIAGAAGLRAIGGSAARRIGATALCVAALALGGRTWVRNRDYHDELRPYHPADLSMAQGILARYAFFRGDAALAQDHYRRILALPPSGFGVGAPERRFHPARVHNDFGNLLVERGALDEARTHFSTAVALLPSFAPAHNNLGVLQLMSNELDGAAASLERAIGLERGAPEARNNLGLLMVRRGDRDAAERELDAGLRITPGYEAIQRNRGALRGLSGAGATARLEPVVPHWLDDPWLLLRIAAPSGSPGAPDPAVRPSGQRTAREP